MILFSILRTLRRYVRIIPESLRIRRIQKCASQGELSEVLAGDANYELIVTSQLGGGTEQFLRNYVAEKKDVLILTSYLYGPTNLLTLENLQTKKKTVFHIEELGDLLKSGQIVWVTVNTLVQNYYTFHIMEIIGNSPVPFRYFVHDYYCICQKYTLFVNGCFCNWEHCETKKCFSEINKLWFPPLVSTENWRNIWGNFLQKAQEIRCFSQSSKDLLLHTYPNLVASSVTVLPHSMSYCSFTPVSYESGRLCVGIVGSINSVEKGSCIVHSFLRYAKNKDFEVFVIGAYQKICKPRGKNIHYMGTYENTRLQEIVEQTGVNVFFFPSICPETFSFLVSEQMMMDLPIVCFDIGAQAYKVRAYYKGMICDSQNPEEIHHCLQAALNLSVSKQ